MKVLLGIGGGEDGYRALSRTLSRVSAVGDDLTIAIFNNPDIDESPAYIESRVRNEIENLSIDADIRILSGNPGSELVDTAESEAFDSLVIGGGERSPLGKITLGSITEFIVLNATVTVTLVR